jgi:hypothetical protein
MMPNGPPAKLVALNAMLANAASDTRNKFLMASTPA